MTKSPKPPASELLAPPGRASWEPGERILFAVTLSASLAVLLWIAWPMLVGKVYVFDDLGDMHIPTRLFFYNRLHDGTGFIWDPLVWCGYYLAGEGQVGMYHPLHRFLYSALDFTSAFDLELFLSYPLFLAGTYLLLRRWDLRRDASMFGAGLFAWSAFNLMHFPHMHVISIMAHMPWLLLAIDVGLRGESPRARAVAGAAVSVIVASMLLLGHAQFVWISGLAAIAYMLILLPHWTLRRVGLVVAAALVGGLIGGVQVIPNYDALVHSGRLDSATYSKYGLRLRPANLIQLVSPYFFFDRVLHDENSAPVHEYAIYDGAVALVLFAWMAANVRRFDKSVRRLAAGMAILAVAGILITLSRYGLIYPIFTKIPIAGSFRGPARYIVLTHFALAVGAAVMYNALARGMRPGRTWALLALPALSVAVTAAAAGGLFARVSWGQYMRHDPRLLYAAPLLLALAAAAALYAARGARPALAVLAVFAVAEQAAYGLSYIGQRPPMTLEAFEDTVRGLPEPPGFWRLEVYPTTDNLPTLKGYRTVTGYVGLTPEPALDYTRETPLRLASTAYRLVKSVETGPDGAPVGRIAIEPVPAPMPRARLVSRAVVTDDPAALVDAIDISTTALVPRELGLATDSRPGTATVTSDLSGAITVDVDAPARQLLVVCESYHEGWKAVADGRPLEVVRAYGDFMGVAVPPGRAEVRLTFDPESLRVGKAVSLAGIVAWLVLFGSALALSFRSGGDSPASGGPA